MNIRKLSGVLTVCISLGIVIYSATLLPSPGWAQLGSGVPSDSQLQAQRVLERAAGFVVAVPPPNVLRPVQRVPRHQFGVVGPFPLTLQDLDALIYPDATLDERQAVLEGMTFFTTPHTAAEGAGIMANQPFCLGCHRSSEEVRPDFGVVTTVSLVSRAARSTPTNFRFTSLDPATGGGRAPDNLDAINNTGRTAAFTIFGDFSPSTNFFDRLDGSTNPVTGFAQQFGGFVQHMRPSIPTCLPDRIPPIAIDLNLVVTDPTTGLSPLGFRRSVGERAGPPYIGRGLMEAVPNADILANEDPSDTQGHHSSLDNFAPSLGCTSDCISGRHNEIPTAGGFVGGVGRFGLRANGVEILQFVAGGLQGELGFTSLLNNSEANLPDINIGRPGCPLDEGVPEPEVHLSTPFSERNHIRLVAPPEFGDKLLKLLQSPDPTKPRPAGSAEGKVQRGAMLFGIDLMAFANRMIPGRMPLGGDGLDLHAINQADRKLNCAGCHTPIHRTGQSPAGTSPTDPVARHLSFRWAPIFSDLLLHEGPVIDAERFAPTPRDPLVIRRLDLNRGEEVAGDRDDGAAKAKGRLFDTFDLPRNLADDVFSSQQGSANGREFRTAPLMGLGRMGMPFLHDARVYLSKFTADSTPAGTVVTSSEFTNAPLVVRSLDDAIRAAIELHDLPAPDDVNTPAIPGAGCPVPPGGSIGNVSYGLSPQDVICPRYDRATSQSHRSEAREVIRRFRALSPEDQQALIEFLKEL